MLNPNDIGPGGEQWEFFEQKVGGLNKQFCQYDCRDADGKLFSTVKPTLEKCKIARDEWLDRRKK